MDEPPISRGFRSRRQEQASTGRIPPGQYVTTDFPVLSAGPTPQFKLEDWTFALQFAGSLLGKWLHSQSDTFCTYPDGGVTCRASMWTSGSRLKTATRPSAAIRSHRLPRTIESPTGEAWRLDWQRARVREVIVETSRVRSLLLAKCLHISLTSSAAATNSNCGGRSGAISCGPSRWAVLSVS